MCEQCLAIENAIERFQLISQFVNDELTIGKAAEVIAELAAQKALLHRLPPVRSNAKRYFFDIRDDDGLLTDDQGLLRDMEAARAEGALLLPGESRFARQRLKSGLKTVQSSRLPWPGGL